MLLAVVGGIYALVVLSLLLFGFIDYYLDVDIVTNRRIVDIEQNGLFKRKISELSIDQVEDVSATVYGFFPTLLHFGDVDIQTAGSRPNFLFGYAPHPYSISKKILDLHDQAMAEEEDWRRPVRRKLSENEDVDKKMAEKYIDGSEEAENNTELEILSGIETDKRRSQVADEGVVLYQFDEANKEGRAINIKSNNENR
jgi:uncharacterized membrane protein YdbT with pleckstrin-like domain